MPGKRTRWNPNAPDYPLDGRQLAPAAKDIIGGLLLRGITEPTGDEIFEAVASHEATQKALTHSVSARRRLRSAVAVYFEHIAVPVGWKFTAAAVQGAGATFDLVWENDRDGVWVDVLFYEARERPGHPGCEDRVEGILDAGRVIFGERFVGVRVVYLGCPRRSEERRA